MSGSLPILCGGSWLCVFAEILGDGRSLPAVLALAILATGVLLHERRVAQRAGEG